MAASKPFALCTLIMPLDAPARAGALRNQKFCRAHSTTHRLYERDGALNPILDRLGDKSPLCTPPSYSSSSAIS